MKKILVCVDFSDGTQKLLGEAATLAKAFESSVYVNFVASPNEDSGSQEEEDMAKDYPEECDALSALAGQLRSEGIDAHALLATGVPSEAIVQEAKKLSADLVVMGTHGKGLVAGTFIGSVSQGVVRHCKIPIHLVPVEAGE